MPVMWTWFKPWTEVAEAGMPSDPGDWFGLRVQKNAGQRGRGKQSGIPLKVLRVVYAFDDAGAYGFEIFKDRETVAGLVGGDFDVRETWPLYLQPEASDTTERGIIRATTAPRLASGEYKVWDVHSLYPSLRGLELRDGSE